MNRRVIVYLGCFLLGAIAGACHEDDPCDSTTVYVDRLCRPKPQDAGAPAMDAQPGGTFGAACRDHPDCAGGEANVCLVPEGSPSGVCSAVGCDATPTLCPTGWLCCDLSRVKPGSPWGCVPLPACP